jgi:two-component system, OmpR family, response regulator QseB
MRLLLVEDDRMLGAGVERFLRQSGHAVDWVQDGEAAVRAISTDPYDIILLDLGLPRRSGLEVLADVRRRGLATPVLILRRRTRCRTAWPASTRARTTTS